MIQLPKYLLNFIKLSRGQHILKPLVSIFHLTGRCNLNCAYCEDYGARRTDNELIELGVLPLAKAKQVLSILRQASPNLILTGGEPLLYPEIEGLVTAAKNNYRFHHLTMLTNGLLLSKHLSLLPHLQQLVISLDSLDVEQWGQTIGMGKQAAQTIIQTIIMVAKQQTQYNFQLAINCVITPQTLNQAESVLNFCLKHNIAFAFSPQSFNNWPHYQLLVAETYPAFVDKVIAHKKQGANIVGSLTYLQLIKKFQPFNCYPTLAPRVLPNGDLIYPCRPIERAKTPNGKQTPHGGRPCNLTTLNTWTEAVNLATQSYGPPPSSCLSCFQQCYAEPSLMQTKPLALLREMLAFKASRKAKIYAFAPG